MGVRIKVKVRVKVRVYLTGAPRLGALDHIDIIMIDYTGCRLYVVTTEFCIPSDVELVEAIC